MVLTCLGEEDHLLGYHTGPRSQHTRRSASAPFPRGVGLRSPCVGLQCGCEGMLGGGPGLLSVRAHFCWGGVGAAKGLLPCFLVPKGNQPMACTLALWWLKFGPTENFWGGGGGFLLPPSQGHHAMSETHRQWCTVQDMMYEVRAKPPDHGTRSAGLETGQACQRISHLPQLPGGMGGGLVAGAIKPCKPWEGLAPAGGSADRAHCDQ